MPALKGLQVQTGKARKLWPSCFTSTTRRTCVSSKPAFCCVTTPKGEPVPFGVPLLHLSQLSDRVPPHPGARVSGEPGRLTKCWRSKVASSHSSLQSTGGRSGKGFRIWSMGRIHAWRDV